MLSITGSILLVFITQAYAQNAVAEDASKVQDQISNKMADDLINKLVDHLISRVLNVGSVPIPQRGLLRNAGPRVQSEITPKHITRAASAPRPVKNLFDPSNSWNPFVMKKSDKGKDSYADWATKYRHVISSGLTLLSPLEAEQMEQEKGAVFLDVRPEHKFQKFTIEDAINVPLFQKVQGHALKDHLKRGVTGALAVEATERNPNFAAMAKERLPLDKPIIIACDRGGKLDTSYEEAAEVDVPPMVKWVNSMTTPLMPRTGTKDFDRYPNRYTMSLKAAYELYQAGFTNLYLLDGGMKHWDEEGFPLVAGDGSEGI